MFIMRGQINKSYTNSLRKGRVSNTIAAIRKDKLLYLLALPGIIYFIIFHYVPMYGITIAFKDYNIYKGFSSAPWVGFQNFEKLFSMFGFKRAFYNTIIISFMKLVIGFPVPILLAIIINEVRNKFYKKFVQTSIFLPFFISWVIVSGLLFAILSPTTGVLKQFLDFIGYQGDIINLMSSKEHFRKIILISYIWHDAGYSSILYTATIATIDQQLYEAAITDGASKLRQIWHITLPGLRNTIVIVLILRVGQLLNVGFEQIFALYNPSVYDVAEILDTYIYKIGINEAKFSLATAAGLFKSSIAMIMVICANYISKKIDEDSGLI